MPKAIANFPHARKAYANWESMEKVRQQRWDKAETDEDVKIIQDLEKKEWAVVQEAFYQDTKKINNREKCDLLPPQYVRQMLHLKPELPGEQDWRKLSVKEDAK